MEVYLIRHTKTVAPPGVCFGRSDVEPAPGYTEIVPFIKKNLPEFPDAVFSSPLRRCVVLAKEIYGTEPVIDSRLMELDFGDWEMKKWDDIPQNRLLEWTENYVNIPPEGGESFSEMYKRAYGFFESEIFASVYKKAAVFTHAGVLRCALAFALGIELQKTFDYEIGHGTVLKLVKTGPVITADIMPANRS